MRSLITTKLDLIESQSAARRRLFGISIKICRTNFTDPNT